MKEHELTPMQECLNDFEYWRSRHFMRYHQKVTKDNKSAELGINGFGNIAIYIDGSEYKTYIQPYTAIEEFNEL